MTDYAITKEFQEQCDDINQKFEQAYADGAHLSATKKDADGFWDYLKKCEQLYVDGNAYDDINELDRENILALYHLNAFIDKGHLKNHLRDVFNLPSTAITSQMLSEDKNLAAGWVAGDGTIYALSRYCQLDYRWTLVMAYYYYYKLLPRKKHCFVKATQEHKKPFPNKVKIVIIGDWGTGDWKDGGKTKCPAQLVIDAIMELSPKPDYIIHLGDVYYAGTPKEEKKHLLKMLPASYTGKLYTMNSNHEMYDGAKGLMGITLKNLRFSDQGCSTYFSIELKDWIIVGLDSAYYDDSFLYMKGSLCNSKGGKEQLTFLTNAYKTNKKVLLMTHHNGIEVAKKGPKPNKKLWDQVLGAMNNNLPDVWYWGHVHNGIVYKEDLSIYEKSTNKISKMRCCGHASIPFGNGAYLENISTGKNPDVLYYAHTSMPDPTDKVQKLRTLNGFAVINIDDGKFTETFYEVKNTKPKLIKVWP